MKNDPLNRLKVKRGDELPWSKLNDEKVIKARRDHERARLLIKKIQNKYSVQGLADQYGVSKGAMEKAISGITWSHLP